MRTPIDAFLLARLEAKGLVVLPPMPTATALLAAGLFRSGRVASDAGRDRPFLADAAPDAYDRLIDRLLDSPHYGERWGRHWLDAAGYVDTIGVRQRRQRSSSLATGPGSTAIMSCRPSIPTNPTTGFCSNSLPAMNWSIGAMPTKFTPEIKELLVATGFLRPAADNTVENELNTADIRHQILYDTVQTFSTNVLGLTIHCAQCHSHKFDPIAQADFYRLLAIFTPAYNVQNWKKVDERFLPDVSPLEKQEIDQHNAEIDRQIAELNRANRRNPAIPCGRNCSKGNWRLLPEAIRQDTRTAVETPAEKRNEVQKYLAEKLGPQLPSSPRKSPPLSTRPGKAAIAQREQQIAALNATLAKLRQDPGVVGRGCGAGGLSVPPRGI